MVVTPDPPVGPVRTCVGCRARQPARRLARVTTDGVEVQVGGPSSGRGAWVCVGDDGAPDAQCCAAGLRRNGFARAWRRALGPELVELVRQLPGERVDGPR